MLDRGLSARRPVGQLRRTLADPLSRPGTWCQRFGAHGAGSKAAARLVTVT